MNVRRSRIGTKKLCPKTSLKRMPHRVHRYEWPRICRPPADVYLSKIEPITKPLPCNLYPSQYKIQSTRAWVFLSHWSNPADPDAAYWWRATGAPLAVMMEHANYDAHAQYTGLLFYLRHIVNRLGPQPTTEGLPRSWRSFMTDDFSPIEYSWTWDSSPKVRYAIEAINRILEVECSEHSK